MNDKDDKELFNEVFNRVKEVDDKFKMVGYFVYYGDALLFNTDGYNALYNIYRLTSEAKDFGVFD